LLLVFALISNCSKIFSTKSIEVSLSNQANYLWNTFAMLLNRTLLSLSLIPPHSPLPILQILNFHYIRPKIQQKPLLILLLICEILHFLLPGQIVISSTILLINQGLSPEQYTITGHYIPLIQDNDITRNQPMRGDSIKPYIPIINEIILLIFDLIASPPLWFLWECNFVVILVHFYLIEIVLHDIWAMLV